MSKPRLQLAKMLGRVQDLLGRARGVAWNDRDPQRMDKLIPAIEEAFNIVVEIRSRKYKR